MSRMRLMRATTAMTSSTNRSALIIFSIHARTSARSGTAGEVIGGGAGDDIHDVRWVVAERYSRGEMKESDALASSLVKRLCRAPNGDGGALRQGRSPRGSVRGRRPR